MKSATDIFSSIKNLGYCNDLKDKWWWPDSGSFEVVIGAILTQNTKWENVEKSLNNLKTSNNLTLEKLSIIDINQLELLIKPSGFFKQKSRYIKEISNNIRDEFNDFSNFKESVDRDWLLNQKGIGNESADAILNYACYKEAFVVDSYTNRLLKAFGYEFERYGDIQEWIVSDIYDRYHEIFPHSSRSNAYALIHGMIVEYVKNNSKRKVVDISDILQA